MKKISEKIIEEVWEISFEELQEKFNLPKIQSIHTSYDLSDGNTKGHSIQIHIKHEESK